MRKSNKLIIVISIILVLIITGAVFAYLFLATDLFKSNIELFGKYFAQEIDVIEKIVDIDTIKSYEEINKQDNYESNTSIKLVHSEGGEVSNPLNNLSMKINFQRDEEQQYFYGSSQLMYEDETYFTTELIKDKEQYGIRFPKAYSKFITIDEEDDISSIAKLIGIDGNILETIIQIINGTEEIDSEQEINKLKDKYTNLITAEISKGSFERQKNAMITYNGDTTKTNAYSVSLTSEQVRTILSEIYDDITDETELPAAKITVYEQKGKTIRTAFEIGDNKIVIENAEQVGEIKTKVIYTNLSNEEAMEYHFDITKIKAEGQEKFEIILNILQGEDNYEIAFISEMEISNDMIDHQLEMRYKKDITTITLSLENSTNIGNEIEKNQSLTEENSRSLSSIKEEERRKQIVDALKEVVMKQTTEEVALLLEKLMVNDKTEETTGTENQEMEVTDPKAQAEINNYNAKFEFYTGEEVSAENVKVLLDIAKGNCSGHSIINIGPIGEDEDVEVEKKKSIMLYIQQDGTNDDSITKVLEEIDDNKKYKVLITYKKANGLIDYITITEI